MGERPEGEKAPEASDLTEEFQSNVEKTHGVLPRESNLEETRIHGTIKSEIKRDVCVLWNTRKFKSTLEILSMVSQNCEEMVEPRKPEAELQLARVHRNVEVFKS